MVAWPAAHDMSLLRQSGWERTGWMYHRSNTGYSYMITASMQWTCSSHRALWNPSLVHISCPSFLIWLTTAADDAGHCCVRGRLHSHSFSPQLSPPQRSPIIMKTSAILATTLALGAASASAGTHRWVDCSCPCFDGWAIPFHHHRSREIWHWRE